MIRNLQKSEEIWTGVQHAFSLRVGGFNRFAHSAGPGLKVHGHGVFDYHGNASRTEAQRSREKHREAQRSTKKHREAQRSTEKHREAQRSTEKQREAQRSTEQHREAQRSAETQHRIPQAPARRECKGFFVAPS